MSAVTANLGADHPLTLDIQEKLGVKRLGPFLVIRLVPAVVASPLHYSGSRSHDTHSGVSKPAEDVPRCDLS
jgi:hypothetical protein